MCKPILHTNMPYPLNSKFVITLLTALLSFLDQQQGRVS